MGQVVVQRLEKELNGKLEKAIAYYSILSALNSLKLPKRQIELLAFTAIRGTITPMSARKEFIETFKSSLNTIENMKGKLTEKGLMINDNGMYKLNPQIDLDFSKPLMLGIMLKAKDDDRENKVD